MFPLRSASGSCRQRRTSTKLHRQTKMLSEVCLVCRLLRMSKKRKAGRLPRTCLKYHNFPLHSLQLRSSIETLSRRISLPSRRGYISFQTMILQKSSDACCRSRCNSLDRCRWASDHLKDLLCPNSLSSRSIAASPLLIHLSRLSGKGSLLLNQHLHLHKQSPTLSRLL